MSASSPPPSSPSMSSGRTAAKAEEIRRVLSEPTVDLWKLRELALTDGGLVNDSLRKLAWPKLVGVHNDVNSAAASSSSSLVSMGQTALSSDAKDGDAPSSVPPSLDREQIERDVSRVTWHLLTGNQRSRNFQMENKHRKRVAQLLRRKQRRLGDFLNLTLVWSYAEEEGKEGRGGVAGEGCDGGDNDAMGRSIKTEDCSFITTTDAGEEGGEETRLRYYQGYHDVASIVLSALGGACAPLPLTHSTAEAAGDKSPAIDEIASSTGLALACRVLLRLSHSHLRDALQSDFLRLQSALRLVVMPLLGAFDAELHSHLRDCDMEPFFCLSWIITWFAHDIRDTALVKRLYDFFIVSHPTMAVYASVAMMTHPLNRIEVLGADCDFACVHHALADLPKNSSDVGWKYMPGEHGGSGYVTGEDGDESSYDQSLQDQSLDDGEEEDGSVVSGVLDRRARVPFQELIELSISLMHKIPPRNLINLARRYHTEITLKPLVAQASTIALLQPPPSWGLASSAESDWVLKQKMREERGLTKLNRHQRKNRLKQHQELSSTTLTALPKKRPRPLSSQAIIASGTGPDGLAEARLLLKKRQMLVRSVAVVVLSVFVVLAKDYFSWQPSTAVERSPRPQQTQRQATREVLGEDSVARLLLVDDDSDSVSVNTMVKDDKASADVSSMREGEMVQKQRTGRSKKMSLSSFEDGEKEEKIKAPSRKKKQISDVCANDEAAAVLGFFSTDVMSSVTPPPIEEEPTSFPFEGSRGVLSSKDIQTSKSVEVATVQFQVQSSEKSPASMVDEENNHTPRKDEINGACANDEPPTEENLDERQQLSSFAREDTDEVLVRSSLLVAKNTLTTIKSHRMLDLQLDQLEQRFDSLMMRVADGMKAAWSRIAPVIMNVLRVGWHRTIIKAGWLNRIATPVIKEGLSSELEGGSSDWAEDAMRTWKKQEALLRKNGKLIGMLARAGKENMSKRH